MKFSTVMIYSFALICALCLSIAQPSLAADAQAAAAQSADANPASTKTDKAGPAGDAENIFMLPQFGTAKSDADKLDADKAETGAEEEDPWAVAWSSQQQFMDDVIESTATLRKNLPQITRMVTRDVIPFEQRLQQDLVMGTTYMRNPRLLEAVSGRIIDTADGVTEAMRPAQEAQDRAKELLKRIQQLQRTIPTDAALSNKINNAALRKYATTLSDTRNQLEEINSRLDTAMTQGRVLREKAQTVLKDLDKYLPKIWVDQYFVPPIRYIDTNLWKDMKGQLMGTLASFRLRMSMEMPQSPAAWLGVGARFATTLFIGLVLAMLGYRRLQSTEQPEIYSHIFHTSVPWLLVGLATIVSSLPADNDSMYNMLLSFGNLLLIVGQISLAWDLRRIYVENAPRLSPFWSLCMPTLVAYVLLYPDLPLLLLGLCWVVVVGAALLWQLRHPIRVELPQFERFFLQMEPVTLWLSLVVTIFGFPRHAILLYLLFAMVAVSLQLSMGSLRLIHATTENIPNEGFKSVFGNILVALTAPSILLLIVGAMAMWILTLPGGIYLLRHYGALGFHIGTTNFNFIQILLIISAFYVTRAIISIGANLLKKMPEHGIRIDKSILPPIQTAFTYAVWAIFGLFCLNALGLDLKNLAVVAGGLSVGIGFGMQNIVNNFLSGLILIFSRSLQEGDVVELGNLNGIVRRINVRATTVETYDNAVIYVPNSEFVSNRIINWTRNSRNVRREITVGVAYGTDPNTVMRLLREIADARPDVLKYPAPTVLFKDFGASTLDFGLRFWVHHFDQGTGTASNIRLDIERVFREHRIEVAFPQLDVHIKEMPPQGAARKAPARALPTARKTPAEKISGGNTTSATTTANTPAATTTPVASDAPAPRRKALVRRRIANPQRA